MAKTIQQYETTMILNTKKGEDGINALVEKFKNLISENGTIDNVDDWGKRRLAYEIEDEQEGYYVMITFTSKPDFPAELDRIYNITEGVLRSIIVKKEEHKAKPQKARKAPVATEAPAQEAKAEEPAADAE